MSDEAARWGVARRYVDYRGEVVESPAGTVDTIVAAMSAGRDHPPDVERADSEPGVCTEPPDRAWGWAIQVYAVRSTDSWGIGDLGDLRRLGGWARGAGASVLLVSPLGAQPPVKHQEPCPYYASSRRFLNPLYLRVDDIAGADRCAAELQPLRKAALALNTRRHIDHDAVFRLKTRALEIVFRAAPRPRGLATWVRGQGRALRDFATFNAIAEVRGPAWRSWPSRLRHPRSAGLSRNRKQLDDRVAFHTWLQFHLHQQLARAAREIALVADVPVGFASDGFDAWRWQDLVAPGIRVGAPPDYFFRDGQDWGMPAFDPWKLADADCEPFAEALHSAALHGGGLRLDHAMSLFRLFWIPEGSTPSGGAYVAYPSQPMLGSLVAESRRAGAFVIGEDLGLVEPEVRAALLSRGVLGYRLLWFEDSPPADWPRDSVAAIGTHDLPTVAGIWKLTEKDERQHHLRGRLVVATGLPDDSDPVDVAVSAYARLAQAQSRIVLASLEDALGVEERPNIPGTTTQWPNWRLSLPLKVEDIERAAGPRRIAEVMARSGRSAT